MGVAAVMTRVSGWLRGPRAPGLELLVGPSAYEEALWRAGPPWACGVLVGTLASVVVARSGDTVFDRTSTIWLLLGTLVVATAPVAVWMWLRRLPAGWVEFIAVPGALVAPLVISSLGPLHQESTVFLPAFAAAVFVFTSRRGAITLTGVALAGYAVTVIGGDGYVDAATRLGVVATFTITTSVLMAWIIERVADLAARERSSAAEVRRLADELTEANATLERRVATQVERIEGLSRLERFLPPQVAQAVLSSEDEALLAPHRQQVAVLFCDLRGFTAFSSTAEPEELVAVLSDYYAIAGGVLRAHGATMGSFLGDGVMAYLNDPFPCADPPGTAVTMARELRDALFELCDRWSASGFRLGFGIGLAWGHATLGTVGFEGRSDYTALGSVVNLASRLCGEAGHGDVLLDARAHAAVGDRVRATALEVRLKGYSVPTPAFRLD
jgi:adenylate cyclase